MTPNTISPSAYTALLLAFIAAISLLAALVERKRARGAYWLILAALFALISAVDYFMLRNHVLLNPVVTFGGAALALGAAYFWGDAPPAERPVWRLLLLGLLLISLGAHFLDSYAEYLIRLIQERFAPYDRIYLDPRHLEETCEMLGMLLMLVSLLTLLRPRLSSPAHVRLFRWAPPAFLVVFIAMIAAQEGSAFIREADSSRHGMPAAAQFADTALELRGYELPGGWPSANDAAFSMAVFVRARAPLSEDFGYTFQLIDQESLAVALSIDEWSDRAGADFAVGEIYRYRQDFEDITDLPRNRAYWLTLSIWRRDDAGNFQNYAVAESEQPQLSETQIILGEFALPPPQMHIEVGIVNFERGITLHRAELPATARAGAPIQIRFSWSSSEHGREDYTQFLHFVHEESGYFWNHDQPPLGARLPSRLWYAGLSERESWRFTLPAQLPPGAYRVYTGLYRQSDLTRLPSRDRRGVLAPEGRNPIGTIEIEN